MTIAEITLLSLETEVLYIMLPLEPYFVLAEIGLLSFEAQTWST